MLTRLRVSGFKNLVDVDLHLGPFNCVAGANGVGKSNLFDAIHFLSRLADLPLLEAAAGVRGGHAGHEAGVQSLFQRLGDTFGDVMSFEAEMILPSTTRDDLGQEAQATTTFVTYSLVLAYREPDLPAVAPRLEILREELHHISRGQAHKHLGFKHSAARWRSTAITGERRVPFISTTQDGDERTISLHQDSGARGHPLHHSATRLPRTVLSGCTTAENPTALLTRREMQSWRLLQLEPAALRRPDELTSASRLGSDGAHLAATLHRLIRSEAGGEVGAQITKRLAKLVSDVRDVGVDYDERRQTLTLEWIDATGTIYPASSLSGGCLRFLALTVLERDPESQGLICLEEPENGVHPGRIAALLELLREMAVDVEEDVTPENPLRQVIVNTHSPAVVSRLPKASLLVAMPCEARNAVGTYRKIDLRPLPGTWRAAVVGSLEPVSYDAMLAYLNPLAPTAAAWRPVDRRRRRRAVDEEPFLPFP